MALCQDNAPPPKGRIVAHAQRCGALAIHDGYCPVHLKQRGYSRCALCSAWRGERELRACAGPGGTDWRPMACAPKDGRRITIKTPERELEAHWCAFVEDHPPIDPAFYFKGPHQFEPVRGAMGWREL